jgi:3',5'-cyclic AMP phosphodiesterase CpdA
MSNDRARWVTRKAESHDPDFIIQLGDIVHPVPHLPTYPNACEVAKEIFRGSSKPVFYVPGNHDIGDKTNPTVPAYLVNEDYISDFTEYFGPQYQSFDHEGIHFVLINSPVLNSGLDAERKQRRWLEADLEANINKRVFLFSHYPPYIYRPDEPGNYDNLDNPARSWLLDLLEKNNVEAFFAGHVHHFGYKKYLNTHVHTLLSTCFVRQDYSEMFRIEAADEHGRNDNAKLGYCIVDVDETTHHVKIKRSYGETLSESNDLQIHEKVKVFTFNKLSTSFGVHLRHSLLETSELPYMGPLDEFIRKKVWNDYPVLGLREAGIRTLRLPVSDLLDQETRRRLYELHSIGHRYGFFNIGTPDLNLVSKNRELMDFLEIIYPTDYTEQGLREASKLRKETSVPVYFANIESSIDRKRKGPKFSHYIGHGFNLDDISRLDEMIEYHGNVDGFIFNVNQNENPVDSVKRISDYAHNSGFKAIANIKLGSDDPAIFLTDNDYVANRVTESLLVAYAYSNVKVLLDTFIDHDRGYFPRIGLYDRRINPRKGALALRNLHSVLSTYGSDISVTEISEKDWRILSFVTEKTSFRLHLPYRKDCIFEPFRGPSFINLVSGEINPGTFTDLFLEVTSRGQ